MKLIKGEQLTPRQKSIVLSAFGYRWTIENYQRAMTWFGLHGKPTVAPIPDEQWLAEHAFQFVNDGSRLGTRKHCEPSYLAEE